MTTPVDKQLATLVYGTEECIPVAEFKEKLEKSAKSGKPLRVKFGADPSAPDLHLGHTVVLQKLRQFQEFGHTVIFVIGDFTGRIGDPTGKSETRKQLSEDQVKANADTYQKQVFKILDKAHTEIRFNSEWLNAMRFSDVVVLAAKYTVARMLERDDFAKRYKEQAPISVHEFLYPLAQGYDSVALNADIELGGTDQKFNLLVGRELQKQYGQSQQAIMTLPLLEGTDGVQKMSKSLGNAVGVQDPASEMFGKIMSISDDMMVKYYRLLTSRTAEQMKTLETDIKTGKLHPKDAKVQLAREIITRYHDAPAAKQASEEFERVFAKGALPENMETFSFPATAHTLVTLLVAVGFATSNGEARRKLQEGAVRIDQAKQSDGNLKFKPGQEFVLSLGKRQNARVKMT
jgi:tyrosyl-tRNA synthetase